MAALQHLVAVFTFLTTVEFMSASEDWLIRGIPLERVALYDPGKDFVCLDGSARVPFSYVNDDYCDCADGSDEPGTAACPNSTFFCPNAGHVPLIIPSSRVNDGICDCCDTSDEYQPGSTCVNSCSSLGEAAREHYVKAMKEQEVGYRARQELVAQAAAKRNELQTKATELKALKEKAEEEVREKEAAKREIEEREKAALSVHREKEEAERSKKAEEEKQQREAEMRIVWDALNVDQDDFLTVSEVQVDLRFDQNKDGVVAVEEAKFFTLNQDAINWEDFSRTGWVLMRPYVMGERSMFTPPEPEAEEEEDSKEAQQEEAAEEPLDSEKHDEENIDDDYEDITPDTPPEPETESHDEQAYDEETQLLVDEADKARKEFNNADRTLRDMEHEMNSIEATLGKDFGPDDAFLPLEGQCMEYTDREYVYKLCFFDRATQKPRHGGGETNLGSWKSWAGSSSNPYEKMMYDNGLGCWNGPNRSAQVALACGKEHRILSVSEPSRCVYYYEVETPAVCSQPPALPEDAAHQQWHEEL